MRHPITVILVLLLSSQVLLAQDPQFSQFYAAPAYMNPGFAGNTLQARGVLNYRNQWPAMPGQFVSYGASFDYNIDALNSGVALAVMHDRAGSAALRYTNLQAQYSYTIRISRWLAMKPGISFGYSFRDINQNELVFGDQIIYENPISNSQSVFTTEPVRYPDLGAGTILYMREWWAGVAFHHINQPDQSLTSLESRLPMRFSFHGGYNLILARDVRRKKLATLSLVAHYKSQGRWDQLDVGTYFKYKIITSGLYYRGIPVVKQNNTAMPNHDAVTALIGFEVKNLAIGYSYDLTISRLITDSGGSHEISIIYEAASKRKKRRRRRYIIPCAKF